MSTQSRRTFLKRAATTAGLTPPFPEAAFLESQDPTWAELKRSRERDECRQKLIRMGLLAEAE